MKKMILCAFTLLCFNSVFALSESPQISAHELIFVSVHPDDAPLTFGGFIFNNNGFNNKGTHVQIYEPFNKSNYTVDKGASDFTNDRVTEVTSLRLKEDFTAYNSLFTTWN